MSAAAAKKAKRTGPLVLLVIVVAGVVLVIPPALAGGLMVPVSKVGFSETTGSLTATQATANVSLITAYEYYFSVRTGGMVRTSNCSWSPRRNSLLKNCNCHVYCELARPLFWTLPCRNR